MRWPVSSCWLLGSIAFVPAFLLLNLSTSLGHADSPPARTVLGRRASALNELQVDPYLLRPTGQRADPINLLFLGSDNVEAVADLVSSVMGWSESSGGLMFFLQGGEAKPQDAQVTSTPENGRRYHLRLKAGQGLIDGQPFILGAVHTDYTRPCGHVGREFNNAREVLRAELAWAGLRVEIESWGNTEAISHCDGSTVAGDGFIVVVMLFNPYQ